MMEPCLRMGGAKCESGEEDVGSVSCLRRGMPVPGEVLQRSV